MGLNWNLMLALTVPFFGTMIGAGAVLGLPLGSERTQRGLSGFSAGAMLAALFWNLLLPGQTDHPQATLVGFLAGIGVVMAAEEIPNRFGKYMHPAAVLMLALVLHNIPEGMAVGIPGEGQAGTILGIALQNIPDGAVAAVPLAAMGMKKRKAFAGGVLSGAVEPVAALAASGTAAGSEWVGPGMMGFAAGAMMYVIIRELAPRMGEERTGISWFALGFGLIAVLSGVT